MRAHDQILAGDVRGGRRRRVDQVVIGRVAAPDRDSAHRDRLASAHLLVSERGAAVARHHVIPAQLVAREGDRGRRRRVVDLVHAERAHVEVAGGDVGAGRGGRVPQVVVAGVGPRDRDPAHRDRLARAHVLVREGSARVRGRDIVTRQLVVGERDRRRGRGVVPPVHARRGDVQVARRDVGGGARGRIGQVVVAGIATPDRDSTHRDRLAVGDILVCEGGRGVGRGHEVAQQLVRRKRHRGARVPVIDLVHAARGDAQVAL